MDSESTAAAGYKRHMNTLAIFHVATLEGLPHGFKTCVTVLSQKSKSDKSCAHPTA